MKSWEVEIGEISEISLVYVVERKDRFCYKKIELYLRLVFNFYMYIFVLYIDV